ncbi:hypothetical protein WA158_000320 [Blastocystis sp. Blastoise]
MCTIKIPFIHNNQPYEIEIDDSLSINDFKKAIRDKTTIWENKQSVYVDETEVLDHQIISECLKNGYTKIEMRQCFQLHTFSFHFQNQTESFHANDYIGQEIFINHVVEDIRTVHSDICRSDLVYIYKGKVLYDRTRGDENYLRFSLLYIEDESEVTIDIYRENENYEYYQFEVFTGLGKSEDEMTQLLSSNSQYTIIDLSYLSLSDSFCGSLCTSLKDPAKRSLRIIKLYRSQFSSSSEILLKTVISSVPHLILDGNQFWSIYMRPLSVQFLTALFDKYGYKYITDNTPISPSTPVSTYIQSNNTHNSNDITTTTINNNNNNNDNNNNNNNNNNISDNNNNNNNSAITKYPSKKKSQKDKCVKLDIGLKELGAEGMYIFAGILQESKRGYTQYLPMFIDKQDNKKQDGEEKKRMNNNNIFKDLKDIELYYNQIYTEGSIYLLYILSIFFYNQLTIFNIGCVFDKLKELQVYNNKFTYKGLAAVCDAFQPTDPLKIPHDVDIDTLDLSNQTEVERDTILYIKKTIDNRIIEKEEVEKLEKWNCVFMGIRSNKVPMNPLDDDGGVVMGNLLKHSGMPLLKDFQIYSSNIGGRGMDSLCRGLIYSSLYIYIYKNMELIELGGNHIGDEGCLSLAICLFYDLLPNLKKLSLFKNEITDQGAKYLLVSFSRGNCQNMKDFRLYNNTISDAVIRAYKECFVQRSEITRLFFINHKDYWTKDMSF